MAAALRLPELELVPGMLFLGDLHLDTADPRGFAEFQAFLETAPIRAPIVLLGDLFEAYVGRRQLRQPFESALCSALRRRALGAPIWLIPGNRDFLLDAHFEQSSGVRLLARGCVARAQGERVLVLHGDELCTSDRSYQRLRRVLRSGPLRWLVPRLPLALSRALAQLLRRRSTNAVAAKAPLSLAQDPGEVRRRALAVQADTLLCGHVHRFRDEQLPQGPRWLVADAFGGARAVLRWTAAGQWSASSGTQPG